MKRVLVLGATLLATTLTARAQEANLPLWEVGVFGGTASAPSYPGSPDRSARTLVLPYLVYRGEVLRMERNNLGARLVHTDDVEFDLGFDASLPSNSQDTTTRQGMPDLGTLIEFGPRLKLTLARPAPGQRLRLDLPLRAVLEVHSGVRQQGAVFEPELQFEARDIGAGWSLGSGASVVIGDRKLNRYFYEVAPQFATAGRPAYAAQAGLIATRLTFNHEGAQPGCARLRPAAAGILRRQRQPEQPAACALRRCLDRPGAGLDAGRLGKSRPLALSGARFRAFRRSDDYATGSSRACCTPTTRWATRSTPPAFADRPGFPRRAARRRRTTRPAPGDCRALSSGQLAEMPRLHCAKP